MKHFCSSNWVCQSCLGENRSCGCFKAVHHVGAVLQGQHQNSSAGGPSAEHQVPHLCNLPASGSVALPSGRQSQAETSFVHSLVPWAQPQPMEPQRPSLTLDASNHSPLYNLLLPAAGGCYMWRVPYLVLYRQAHVLAEMVPWRAPCKQLSISQEGKSTACCLAALCSLMRRLCCRYRGPVHGQDVETEYRSVSSDTFDFIAAFALASLVALR